MANNKYTITHLDLYAGMNKYQEAYLENIELGSYVQVRISTCNKDTFEFEFFNDNNSQCGRLEFDREQAYFLHSWLDALLYKQGK